MKILIGCKIFIAYWICVGERTPRPTDFMIQYLMKYRRIFADGYSYYLTLVTQGRKPILIDNIDLLRYAFRLSKDKYDYSIDAIVILPEHIHMIITPKRAEEYPKIISAVKRSFVYGLDKALKDEAKIEISASKYKRSHAGIWQERFYEHTIRDEKDWLEKMEYIKNNPVKHGYVEEVKEWKYSSFA
ncbi:MAG: transposase [Sulfurovum sp.]|nr:transposase [Sulfurovum sp.]